MLKKLTCYAIVILVMLTNICNAQSVLETLRDALKKPATSQQRTLKTVTIVSTTKKLNGGARAAFGGGFGAASRIQIPVQLPPNTVEWYYSFTTSSGNSDDLKLALQIGGLITSLTPAGIATALVNGLSKQSAQNIQAPVGSMPINAYLMDAQGVAPFLNKVQFSRYENESSERSTQGVVKINGLTQGTYYIGLLNLSSTSSVSINIEVVAIVAE